MTDGSDRRRVVSHERSNIYHLASKSWGRSRCGSVGISDSKLEAGVIEIEPRQSADGKDLRPCKRCFDAATDQEVDR
jgi:hypothetical protein